MDRRSAAPIPRTRPPLWLRNDAVSQGSDAALDDQTDAALLAEYGVCRTCMASSETIYCLPERKCRSRVECTVSAVDDCCTLFKHRCSLCVPLAECGFCTEFGCLSGTLPGPTQEMNCADWHYIYCPSDAASDSSISQAVFGLLVAIGVGVLLVGGTLIFLFTRHVQRKRAASQAIRQHYQKHTTLPVCQHCREGLATVRCAQCKLDLCSHCANVDRAAEHFCNHEVAPIPIGEPSETNAMLYRSDSYVCFRYLLQERNDKGGA